MKNCFLCLKKITTGWFKETVHQRSLEFQQHLSIRAFNLDQYFTCRGFLAGKAKLWGLFDCITSQRAREPSPFWSPSYLGKDKVGRGKMHPRGYWRAFDLGVQGILPYFMPQFPHLHATQSSELFLNGGSEEQGAEEVENCKESRDQEFRPWNQQPLCLRGRPRGPNNNSECGWGKGRLKTVSATHQGTASRACWLYFHFNWIRQ